MERKKRPGEGWREVPALLEREALRAAAKSWLEKRGFGARQLEPKRRQRAAVKKPPLPPSSCGEKGCFGVSLESQQPRVMLEPIDGRGQGVWLPRAFVECVCELRERVGSAGIFRKSGSLARQRLLRATLECGEGLRATNIHDVASVLKQYLRELPTPLIPHILTPSLEWAWSRWDGEKVDLVMCALLQLPQLHLQMTRELCLLLSSVAKQHSQSLMDSHSLAVVMAPNIMPTQHSNPASLETTLSTNTGIVQLMIDHAHLIGLATDHVINHAHQLSKEGVASGSSSSESLLEGGVEEEGRERHKRSSVTDRVLGWGTKLITTIGGVSRDLGGGSCDKADRSPGGLQLGETTSENRLFDPSLPPHMRPSPATPHGSQKRKRSFLSARRLAHRRHGDGRHGHKSLFPNPFRGGGGKGAELSRFRSGRFSERRFPWLQGCTPSTPDPNVQLVGFGQRSSLTGDDGDGSNNERSNLIVANHAAVTPVLGNSALLASALDDSVGGTIEREGGVNEGAGPGERWYSVTRSESGKRMRCEGVRGEGERAIKRRHTIYSSHSRDSLTKVGGANIRSSKSATALGQVTFDPSPSFRFSKPTPQHTTRQGTTATVAMETENEAPPTSPGVPFTFSNPRLYVARRRMVANGDGELGEGVRVCGASPIPRLPEITRSKNRRSFDYSSVHISPCQLDEGFLKTPHHPHTPHSPDLLRQISSELVDRYPLATPLAMPPCRETGLNDSYRRAVYPREPVSPVRPLQFTVTPDDKGSEVMQEVSFTFQLNSPCCHGDDLDTPPPSNSENRVPVIPFLPSPTPSSSVLEPLRPSLQRWRRFPLTPAGPRFTDLSSSSSSALTAPLGKMASGRTPRVRRRAQMYVIPSYGCQGDKENTHSDTPTTTSEWIV